LKRVTTAEIEMLPGLLTRTAAAFAVMAIATSVTSAQPVEKHDITIAVSGPPAQLYFLPVVLAKQLGYFDGAGVNVELQHFNAGSKALESMIGGSADIVAGAYENTIRMQARGVRLESIVLFGRYPENVLGIAKWAAPSYHAPADLKGKTIGITGPGAATQTFLNLILENAGLQPSDVVPVTVGAGAVAVAAMRRSNELFAISNLDLAISELAMAGDIVIVFDSRTEQGTRAVYGGDYASGSLYTTASFVQKNPRTAQAVATAMVRTLKWMKGATASEITARLPAEFYQANPAVYGEALKSNLPSFSPDGLMPNGAPENVLRAMVKFNPDIAKANPDVRTTWTNEFVERAQGN
jgi:NitT/TauT family transport system substrate-binding protein